MTIPEIRAKLEEIMLRPTINPLDATDIFNLISQLKRRPAVSRGKPASRPVTTDIELRIKHLRATEPDWTQAKIAHQVGVNPGRVSEVLAGKRT